ncbi:MAG TPA: orotate phosphoribosyltransferase [Gammaproteobacteria bacterium]|nr:orotate phosphoribosyltransferase [Gammaproteobacteria bacterium]
MEAYKTQFLELALELEALKFGEFKLKSGRMSPYFFNAGLFNTGYAAAKLGRCYASAIAAMKLEFDMLFGPAYKGIGLVMLTAAALAEHYDQDYPFAYNRKEAKDHGEGGSSIGAPIRGRVLILDDVITAGTAINEAVEIVKKAGATPAGVLVALDREEIGGRNRLSAVRELEQHLRIPIRSIISLTDLVDHLEEDQDYAEYLASVRSYRNRYGIAPTRDTG